MADIKIPNFINFVDCRNNAENEEEVKAEPKKMSGIEKEAIINYAKSLSSEEIKVFLDQIPTEVLLGHISFRAIDTECKLNSLKKKVLETL